ncbi:MAG: twin-arginine translocase subunit TatC [Candidatus Marinimicrobia bacterium]|nr:twin-arginine translocase subunit TatC [Candidatus Neomarinimicrobiota bacterium]|tara:strand:- start:32146 stop:32865 length:720 start_codon:yes stop_codon:yes gene_type:complete
MIKEMTFLEHLLELRGRLLKFFLSIVVFSIIGYYYADIIIQFLIRPISDPHINLQVLKITSIFITKLTVAFFFGVILSFPVFLYQLLAFILPVFNKKVTFLKIVFFISLSIFLLILGFLFGYYVMIPTSVTFFKSISLNLSGLVGLNYTLENYLIYLIWILMISSFVYQMPILIFMLIKIGIADLMWFKSNRHYVIVIFFILAALLTPPDPISQIMIAFPLILLYEFSLLFISIIYKNK